MSSSVDLATTAQTDLDRTLRRLTVAQLAQVRDLVSFLATGLPGPESPTLPQGPPTEGGGAEGPAAVEGPAAESDMSLAWMLRLVMGDASLGDVGRSTDPIKHRHLSDVPLVPQQQSEWCWAATAQMILQFHGQENLPTDPAAAQLALARSVDPLWRDRLTPQQLNSGGWPPFESWGFEATVVSAPDTLSPQQVQAEIKAGRPFAISWHYGGGRGHMLVIVGYLTVGEVLWLVAHDPWPTGQDGGDRSLISYRHYATGMAGTWRSYFEIQPSPRPHIQYPTPRLPASTVPPKDKPQASNSGWDGFLETLGDSAQRNQVVGEAIRLLKSLAQPGARLGDELGIFGSDPGDPEHFHFFHLLPVLNLPSRLPDLSDEVMLRVFSDFNRAVIMIGGEKGHLTSITVRRNWQDSDWKVIRIGRSHLVQAFHRLNGLLAEGVRLTVRGQEILASRHLTHLPLVMLRLPDARQYLLMMEVVGAPRQHVPFLFFPVYDDPSSGFEAGQILTWEDLQAVLV